MSEPGAISALHQQPAGTHVVSVDAGPGMSGLAGIVLRERRLTALMQLNGAPEEAELSKRLGGLKPAAKPLRASSTDDLTLLWNGPGQWLIASDSLAAPDLRARVETALDGTDATLTDLSQARTVITVSGPQTKALVAKGCPLDIDSMQAGDTAATLLSHFSVQVHCRDNERFDIYVFRSFGLALWEWLLAEAREFGYEASRG